VEKGERCAGKPNVLPMLIIDRYWYAEKPTSPSKKLSPLPSRHTHAAAFRASPRWRSPSPRRGRGQGQQAEGQASPTPADMREQMSSTSPQFHLTPLMEVQEQMSSSSPQFSPRGRSPELAMAKAGQGLRPQPPAKDADFKRHLDKNSKRYPRPDTDWHWTLRGGGGGREMEWSILSDLDFGKERQRSPTPLPPPKPRLPDVLPGKMGRKLSRKLSRKSGDLLQKRADSSDKDEKAKKGKEGKESKSKSPPRSVSREGVADQIILVPSGAAQKRLKLRKAIRSRLENCHTLESLQEASYQALSVMRKGGPQQALNVGGPVAELVHRALWRCKESGGVLHDVWRSAVQQVVGQEVRRRQDHLYTLHPRNEQGQAMKGSEVSVTKNRRGATVQVKLQEENEADVSITRQAQLMRMNAAQREKRWKGAFGRLSSAFRLRREDIMRALELSGLPYPRRDWAEEVYNSVTTMQSLNSEEYIQFVHGYVARQEEEQRLIFNKFDADKDGSIDTKELATMVKATFSIEPLDHVLEDVIRDVDADGTGTLNLAEFELFMASIVISEGFARSERQELWQVFRQTDKAGIGHIAVEGLCGVLEWLGYRLTSEEVDSISIQVDVDGSGSIDFHEFLVCMRKYREREITSLKEAIEIYDQDNTGTVNQDELEQILRSMGYIPDREAIIDAVKDAKVPSELTLSDLWKFLEVYRAREGLSVSETAEVEQCFHRYDQDGQEEISTLDVGKALRWFGYQVTFDMQQKLISQVDLDCSGRISFKELLKLIRMYWEGELKKMQDAFAFYATQMDGESSGILNATKVEKAFRRIDFIDANRKTPPMPAGLPSVDLHRFMSMGIAFKKAQREIFRENGGFSHDEVVKLQKMFNEFDDDNSDSIGTPELGALIRKLFPIMNKNIRPKLDMLMKEIVQCTGKLNFDDFLRTMRQFYDIQTQERLNKEAELVAETGFTPQEVQGFRELFQKSDENWDQELSLTEVKHMIQNVCPLGDRNEIDLVTMYKEVRNAQAAKQTKFDGNQDNVDFPEFLLLMKKLLDCNFANIQERLKTYDGSKRSAFQAARQPAETSEVQEKPVEETLETRIGGFRNKIAEGLSLF